MIITPVSGLATLYARQTVAPGGTLISPWCDVREFREVALTVELLSLVGTTPFWSCWAEAATENFDTVQDPDNWAFCTMPHDGTLLLANVTADQTPSVAKKNIYSSIGATSSPVRRVAVYNAVPAEYLRLRLAFSGSYGAGEGATFEAILSGK